MIVGLVVVFISLFVLIYEAGGQLGSCHASVRGGEIGTQPKVSSSTTPKSTGDPKVSFLVLECGILEKSLADA